MVDLDDLYVAEIPADLAQPDHSLDEERGLDVHEAEVVGPAAVVDEAAAAREGGADVEDASRVVDLEVLGEDRRSEAACWTDSSATAFDLLRYLEALHQARALVDRLECPAFANAIVPKHDGRC